MGLFFNRKKDKKSKKITISIENWEAGLLSKDYLFDYFANDFMYWCDRFYYAKENLIARANRNSGNIKLLIETYQNGKGDKSDELLYNTNSKKGIAQDLSLRNVGMMQTITVLQYLDIFVKTDADYTIDNILNHFYSSEELQKKQLDRPFAKIRTREEVDEYITLLQKIRADFEPFDENEDFYNELGLLRDKNGNLLEPDWYADLIELPAEVIEYYKYLGVIFE